MSNSFTPSDKSRVRRRPQRASYDEDAVFGILDAAFVAHIAYAIDGQPFVTPTTFWREGRTLYWHGSAGSRMTRAQAAGLNVCVTVTHIDGLVLARSAFAHSALYRSVMAFGRTHLIEDIEDKRRAMIAFVDRLFPGRSATLRPMEEDELRVTSIIAMPIEEAAAKVRGGGVTEKREEDYAFPAWAGIIPFALTSEGAIADPRLAPGVATPAHVSAFAAGARVDDVMAKSVQIMEPAE